MLEFYFSKEAMQAMMAVRNLLAECITETAHRFHEEGYQFEYTRGYLQAIMRFGDWLQQKELALWQVTPVHASEFLSSFDPPEFSDQHHRAHRRQPLFAAVRGVMSWINEHHAPIVSASPMQVAVEQYTDHLRRNRGLCEGSISLHRRGLQVALNAFFEEGEVCFTEITTECIHAYIDDMPRTRRDSARHNACTALRGYFRFLEMQGIATKHLSAGVPILPSWRAALSPIVLTQDDVTTLLDSIDRTTACGKREHAVILCLYDLGMRIGDVARLSLDDIDWQQGTIRIANHKQDRPYHLPLPQRVGDALAEYLIHGRPSSLSRTVFVRHTHPVGLPIMTHALKRAINRIWERSPLHGIFSGTHILRHSAATRMKQQGVPLKSIADVLGHRSLQTTVLYAQVDLPALRNTAQAWPGGQS